METRANYVIVGIFTLAAILAAFGFVYWSAAVDGRGETAELRIRIPGSASGLGRGSAVLYNGVKVGDVSRVYIDALNPTDAIADTRIDVRTPITTSTQADIGLAGLTGQANIELKGSRLSEPSLIEEAAKKNMVAEITANPSAVTNLLQTAQDIFKRADSVLGELEGFTKEARGPLTDSVNNVKTFTDGLAKNADAIDNLLASVSTLSKTLDSASVKLDSTLTSAEDLLNSVDRDELREIITNVTKFTKTLSDSSDKLGTVVSGVDDTVRSIGDLVNGAKATIQRVGDVAEHIDPTLVSKTLKNFEQASESATRIGDDIRKVTDKFSTRSGDIDQAISSATELAQRLNQSSVRVDGILVKVDTLLGSEDADGLAKEAKATLQSFKQVADQLNAKIGTILDGMARFSGQGLRDVEDLARDSRRSVQRIEETVNDLGRNPQRIIQGGDGVVRQYDGRARR